MKSFVLGVVLAIASTGAMANEQDLVGCGAHGFCQWVRWVEITNSEPIITVSLETASTQDDPEMPGVEPEWAGQVEQWEVDCSAERLRMRQGEWISSPGKPDDAPTALQLEAIVYWKACG